MIENWVIMSNIDERIFFEPTAFNYENPNAEVVIVGWYYTR